MYKNPKKEILSSAKEIVSEKGISNTNIRLVAKNSGISIGTVYNYYATKADLLVAVIEDFWADAFKEIDLYTITDKSFYEKIEGIYTGLYQYLHKFKTNWLEQMSLLSIEEKKLGRKKEGEYFTKIRDMIVSLIDEDEGISNQIQNIGICKERIAEFVFDNMLLMLKKDEKEIGFFIVILKRIISA